MRQVLESFEGVTEIDTDFPTRTASAKVPQGVDPEKILSKLKDSENAFGDKMADSAIVQ